jgi:hypothetical protein
VIADYRQKVEALGPALRELEEQERADALLTRAEEEEARASNLLLHEAEIHARPVTHHKPAAALMK